MILSLDNGEYIKITVVESDKGVYQYYTDGTLIGVYNPSVMKDNKFLEVDLQRINTLENELSAESKDSVKQIIEKVKEKMNDIELQQIEKEAQKNKSIIDYLEENDELEDDRVVKSITVQSLEKKIPKEKDSINEKDKLQEDEKRETQQNETTEKDVNVKQRVDLDERATDVESLRQWLGGNIPKEFKEIGVIESYQMSQIKDENGKKMKNPTTRYGLVLIGKDGKVEPLKNYIPQLEQNHSSENAPIESKYQINADRTVEKDAVSSEYRVGNKVLQLDKDSMDNLEVNIGKYGPFTNNLVTTRMRDQNTLFATDIDTRRAAMGHYDGVYDNDNSYKEAKEHEEAGCPPEKLTDKEIDGDKNTGHTHINEQEIDIYVKELMQNEKINEVFTEREVREKLTKNLSRDNNDEKSYKIEEDKSIKEIKEATEQELEEDASHFPTRGEIPQ